MFGLGGFRRILRNIEAGVLTISKIIYEKTRSTCERDLAPKDSPTKSSGDI